MQVKTLSIAVAAALYSASAAYATGIEANNNANKLQAPNITFDEVKALSNKVHDASSETMLQNNGLNVKINAQTRKFVEEGITGESIYIVKLRDNAVALEARDIQSPLARSLQQQGVSKIFEHGKPSSPAVIDYQNKLLTKQQSVMQSVASVTGRTEMRRQFTKAINGFSVKMTEAEARRVSELGSVSSVMRSKNYDLLSDEGPRHIGADQVWNGTSVPSGIKGKGEGQIVGIIDTGINSDHPSFAEVGGDGYVHTNPLGDGNFLGDCVDDAEFIQCNNKLIGVRSYDMITDVFSEIIPGWPAIGEDYQGHGSHVASTAAGNVVKNVPLVTVGAGDQSDGMVIKEDLFPEISGVAPHANIISYQVCYPSNDIGANGCPGEILLAGIEDAISDGVDVINFSIGGSDSNSWTDPVQLAFLAAREAGINVAAAAGNSGQGCGSAECFGYLDNSSPWLAQVAATTHGRSVVIETPVEYAGFADASMGSEVPSWSEMGLTGGSLNQTDITGVVVWAKDYADVNGVKDANGYCTADYPAGTFDFYKDGSPIVGAAEGETNVIVICQRHDPQDPNANARGAKSDHIKAGGADGFIMFNRNRDQGTVAEGYSLPSVHFTYDQWNGVYPNDGLEDWVDSFSEKGHMITIKATNVERIVNAEDADWLAPFSSRGPSYPNREVLAPALAAPGVDIYAAYADEHPFVATPYGTDYSSSSGTSMASPHVAGAMTLLRQVHPDWSATEIQSALSMTADNVVKYHRLNNEKDTIGEASVYRAGAGRINVANAAKAGFVMDESAENFIAANPDSGGTPHKLNMPNLVNFSCKPECQWVRTITATEDGTWTVSNEEVVNWNFDMNKQIPQNGINFEITPNKFSLKAGETQTIIVKASIMETQDWSSNSEVELHSNLLFKAEEENIPDARWPVVFKYDRGDLPANLTTVAHSDKGSYVVQGVELPVVSSPVAQAYMPVEATIDTFELPKDKDNFFPWASNRTVEVDPADILDEATYSKFITVPADSKRLVVEVVGVESELEGNSDRANPLVYIGKDYNGDGEIQIEDEILCVSGHVVYNNFCNINNPEEGEYWAVIYNPAKQRNPDFIEKIQIATAVVSNDVADTLDVTLPASDGVNPVDMTINWDMNMNAGGIYYSAIDAGTSTVNPDNLGTIPLRIERGVDVVDVAVGTEAAKVGDLIPVSFNVLANNSGADREFSFDIDAPAGLNFHSDRIEISSTSDVDAEVVDGKLVISGVQPDTRDVQPDYLVTNNVTDEMCRLPSFGNSNPGGYVNLSDFGIFPMLSGFQENGQANYGRGWIIPVNTLFNGAYDKVSLFNNGDEVNMWNNFIQVKGIGTVDTLGARYLVPAHLRFPYENVPYENMAPLWRGWSITESSITKDVLSVGLSASEGISLASTANGWAIIEWDNASDYGNEFGFRGQYSYDRRDNSFDFQLIFNAETRFGKNEHEIYYAYDNIDFGSTGTHGSIGVQGFKGQVSTFGPLGDYLGVDIAYDNIDEVVKDDYIVCMDYVGPEMSQFEVTAWAEVLPSAAGQTLALNTIANVDGIEAITKFNEITVPSNITVVALDDMVTTEETAISFDVHYIDETNSKNEISVISDNVSFEVDGDTVTVTPNENFYGETEVTVVVSDIENPSDAASTTFMLTVTGVSDAPVANVANTEMVITEGDTVTLDASASMDPDGDELSYSWQGNGVIADASAALTTVSGLTAGDHVFTVTVSDGELETSATVNVKVVTVAERLAIDAISNQSVDEDSSTEIAVNFDNQLGKETVITAMADNAEVEVMGHETGSMLKLTPAANFNGEIEVTVMVAYTDEPSAVAQTTFTLTVNAVNDAPVVELAETHLYVREGQVPTLSATASDLDGDELTYEWTGPGTIESANSASTKVSGLVAGDYVYTVTVSDGTTTVEQSLQLSVTEVPEVDDSDDDEDSSGSLAWLTLLMAGFAGLRRRKAKRS